jgi:hypothetical protein
MKHNDSSSTGQAFPQDCLTKPIVDHPSERILRTIPSGRPTLILAPSVANKQKPSQHRTI